MTHLSLCDRYATLREEKNLSIVQLAKILNCNAKTISFYENGTREMPRSVILKYAKYFGVTSDWLLGLSDNKLYENAEIGKRTGLSDKAIEYLEIYRKYPGWRPFMPETLNLIITNERFIDCITRYVLFEPDGALKNLELLCDTKNNKMRLSEVVESIEESSEGDLEFYEQAEGLISITNAKTLFEHVMFDELVEELKSLKSDYRNKSKDNDNGNG